MSRSKSDLPAVEKMLALVDALAGCAVHGASNTALANGLGFSPSNVTVLMRSLITKGWARKDEATGHFHPTAKMGQVFGRVLADIDKAERHIAEIKHNFTRI